MAHDVFISHARKDKGIADALCEKLESASVRCWIADRDISAGEDWTEVTRNAIGSSRLMILVLSENANAAPHIEREIAHAFYTGRIIIPLRVTDTLPRRDFLFYLGNVRCFDASSPPAEQHLDAFTASINGMVRDSAATGNPVPSARVKTESKTIHYSDSWLGALQASHYGTLVLLKRLAIAACLVAVGLLLWLAPWQTKQEYPSTKNNLEATYPGPDAAPDSTPQTTGDGAPPKSAYVYSRFGLWVPPNNGTKNPDLPQPREIPPTSSTPQPASATPPPKADLDQAETTDTESPGERDEASARFVPGGRTRIANRQQMHRRKTRLKHHIRSVPGSEDSLVGWIGSRLNSVWRKVVVRSRKTGD